MIPPVPLTESVNAFPVGLLNSDTELRVRRSKPLVMWTSNILLRGPGGMSMAIGPNPLLVVL